MRENILFCKSYDEAKYNRVVRACQLIADLRSWPAGDLTMIGEKGVNLSGGQKARVSLARALYTNADIYLFDDPLAAVDLNVARSIFKHCISNEGLIRDKTRLLVTHQVQFLPNFDHCLLLDHGIIEKQGSFDEIITMEKTKELYEKHQYQTDEGKEARKRNDSDLLDADLSDKSPTEDPSSILQEETSLAGNVGLRFWVKLFTARYGSIGLLGLIVMMLLDEAVYNATNKWLSIWSSKTDTDQRATQYAYVYMGLVHGTMTVALLRADYFFYLVQFIAVLRE